MQELLKVAFIQGPLIWHNADANRVYFEQKIRSVSEVDIFILPEMFTTGFTMNPDEVAEQMDGETVKWMSKLAAEQNCALTGSIVIKEHNKFYNRLLFITENGDIHHYDKRHLFTLAGEQHSYSAGNSKLIIDYKGWKICPLICYDLRFPVFSRNKESYDLLIYIANWPKIRTQAWDILLPARAVENLSYVAGVNRIGIDENQHQYSGHSQVLDEFGTYIIEPNDSESVKIAVLSKSKLIKSRKKFGFLNDMDDFTVK